MSGTRQLTLVVVWLSAISLLSKVLGFVREQVVAGSFGVSATTDAFYAAQALPTLLHMVVAAAVATAVVPLFAARSGQGKEQVGRLVSTAVLFTGVVFALEGLLLWATAPRSVTLLVPGLDAGARAEAVSLARIHAATLLLMGLAEVLTGLANAGRQFLLPAIAGLGSNVAVIGATILLGRSITAAQLTWAILVGYALHLLLMIVVLRRSRQPLVTLRPDWGAIRDLCRLSLPLLLSYGLVQITPVIELYLASHLDAGSIAALNYGLKMAQLPVGVVSMGISAVLFARFSHLFAAGRLDDLAAEVGRTMRGMVFVLAPATLLVAMLPRPLVALAFERGTFDSHAVAATAGVLPYYALGLLPMAALPVLTRILSSLRQTGTQLLAALAGTVVFMGLAFWLSGLMAGRGLALALSLSQYITAGLVVVAVVRRLGARALGLDLRFLGTTAGALLAAGAGVKLAAALVTSPLALLALGGVLAPGGYLAVHLLGRTQEARWLAAYLSARKERGMEIAKRILDLCGAVFGLVLLAPVMAVAACAIWLTMGGPVLFRQERSGRHGRPFVLLKFRSMRDLCGPDGKPLPSAVRLTGLGRFLRASSIDELPQLFNVLKGDLSLVGPRPLLPRYMPHYTERERLRFAVRPGITGWAQIHGRNRLPWNERLEMDAWYVEHRSFLLDLKILALTVGRVLRPSSVAVDSAAVLPSLDKDQSRLRARQ